MASMHLAYSAVFLAVAALAGCTDGTSSTPGGALPGDATGGLANGLHNVSFAIGISTPGVHATGGGADVPSGPGDCQAGVHETIFFDDAAVFNGTVIDHATACDSAAQRTVAGYRVFTGSITGCSGSGTATFPWVGQADASPVAANPNGEVIHAHDLLTTPTNTTGFVGIEEAWMDADFTLSPVGASGHGTLTGYIVCS